MGDIYLVRHGQAQFGAEDYDALTDLGRQQCGMAGAHWHFIAPVQHFVRGGMVRHRQSAEAFAAAFDEWQTPLPEAVEDPGWNEFDHEAVFAAAHPKLAAREALMAHLAGEVHPQRAFHALFEAAVHRWVGGGAPDDPMESYAEFEARVAAALDRLRARMGRGETAVVITSGGVITSVVRRLLDIPRERAFDINWSLVNSGVTRLRTSSKRVSLMTLNETPHLHGEPDVLTWR